MIKLSEKSVKTDKRAERATTVAAVDGTHDDADKSSPKSGQDGTAVQKTKPKKKRNYWALKITIVSLVLSAFISFLTELTSSAENIIVTVILLLFLIMASILFDGIGVAVTSCDITPIVSMASKKEYGAKTAMWLVKNNEKVSNVCNDVIGDIFGIISGACGAAIAIKIVTLTDDKFQQWIAIAVSAVVSALTIGGKAFLKNIAITNSKEFVMFVARIIGIFHPEERRRKKKEAEKKKKYAASGQQSDVAASEGAQRAQSAKPATKARRDKTGSARSIKPVSVVAAVAEDGKEREALSGADTACAATDFADNREDSRSPLSSREDESETATALSAPTENGDEA